MYQRRKWRTWCLLIFVGWVTSLYVVIFSSFLSKFPAFSRIWKQQGGTAEERRPRAFYRWIDESGRTLSGTKPPVYGLLLLLDPDSSGDITSRQGGDTLIERAIDCNFGYSSYHQVYHRPSQVSERSKRVICSALYNGLRNIRRRLSI